MPRITITEPGKSPQPYRLKLDRQETTIGRASDNAIVIEAGSASTHHCVMKRVEGGFILEDLGSTNGLKVDDTRFQIIDLEDNTTVHIGDDVELHFSLTEDELDVLELEDFTPHEKLSLPKKKAVEPTDLDDDDFDEVPRKKRRKRPADFEEDDDFEDAPRRRRPAPAAAPVRPVAPIASAKSSSPASTLVFFALCIVALFLGLIIRHYQDTGTFLFAK